MELDLDLELKPENCRKLLFDPPKSGFGAKIVPRLRFDEKNWLSGDFWGRFQNPKNASLHLSTGYTIPAFSLHLQ